jgi:cysteinyl-tRNA synthetase
MFRDLNTPQVLANVSQRLTTFSENLVSVDGLKGFEAYLEAVDQILGLNLLEQLDIHPEQKSLIAERDNARQDKNWQKSDEIRDQLVEQGIGLRDTTHGTIWYRL